MFKVAVIGKIREEGMKIFQSRSDVEAIVLEDLSPEGIAKGIEDVDAISVRTQELPKEILSHAKNLKIVSRHGVGVDNVDVAYLSSKSIPVAIAVDANYTAVAEHTLMMMLCLAKDTYQGQKEMDAGNYHWRGKETLQDLLGRHILIMGAGRIGYQVGMICQVFGMKVSFYDPFPVKNKLDGANYISDWRALFPEVDFVSLHMPATNEVIGMIGEKELASMKKSAFIINCARGGIIDEDALANALEKEIICGAGLDVFLKEPHDHTHPLFKQKRFVYTPHNAALTAECSIRMATQCAQNIINFFDNKLEDRVVFNLKDLSQ